MLMCYHNSCDTGMGENLAQFLPHLAPCLHIQGRQRLIEQQQLWVQSQGACNRHPLLLTS